MALRAPLTAFETTAAHFAAIGEFLSSFDRPGRVVELVDILNVGDPIRFEAMIGPYGDPRPLCSVMCHVAVEVLDSSAGKHLEQEYRLRTNLDRRQGVEAAGIYAKHFGTSSFQRDEKIVAGPYRDELEGAGFLARGSVFESGPLTGAREFVCQAVCPAA